MMRALVILIFAMLAASSHALSNTRLTEWYVPQTPPRAEKRCTFGVL